jgi:hypothetical protein
MKTQHQEDYLLLFRGNAWLKQLSDAEVQKVTSEWMNWFDGLVQQGKCKGGHPLRDMGKLVTGKRGHIVIDGPFAESKEAIGGYFHLQVADEDEAVAIAQKCPGLGYGCVVEVRPLAERCTDRVLASQAAIASG